MMNNLRLQTNADETEEWCCADVRTDASAEAVSAALGGVEVEASIAYRPTLGVVRLIARDRVSLQVGTRIVSSLSS
jgi:hypothetical protein